MSCFEFDIWLHVSREGRCFSYQDGNRLDINLGDVVSVRLKGRSMQGLVVAKRKLKKNNSTDSSKEKSLLNIDKLVQKGAVDEKWREWIEEIAYKFYVSPFRMLKAALPPGLLGASNPSNTLKKLWWVKLTIGITKKLSQRQDELRTYLISTGGGDWQKELQKNGFSSSLIRQFISNGYGERGKRLLTSNSLSSNPFNKHENLTLEKPQSLTLEQKAAKERYEALNDGAVLLLWGVTGSGKTEVYLQIASTELAAGRHCLILTPEI